MATGCADAVNLVVQHQAPELEALLPTRVAGRALATWSVRGRCWLEMAYGGTPADVDALIADADESDPSQNINVTRLAMAVAGRSDTKADPPYLVFGIERGPTDEEIELALFLLFGGAGYVNPTQGADLSAYHEETISGKQVHVGDTSMLSQTEHVAGKPYLYQTDDQLFMVVADDRAWAEEALEKLP
jgi:hypothetical protein